jgi:hypothetical protein
VGSCCGLASIEASPNGARDIAAAAAAMASLRLRAATIAWSDMGGGGANGAEAGVAAAAAAAVEAATRTGNTLVSPAPSWGIIKSPGADNDAAREAGLSC